MGTGEIPGASGERGSVACMLWYASYYEERAFCCRGTRGRHAAGVDPATDTRPPRHRGPPILIRRIATGIHGDRAAQRQRAGAKPVAARRRDRTVAPAD